MERRARVARRRQLREARQAVLDDRASHLADKIHSDDPTLYKEQVWQKINTLNGKPIPLGDLVDAPERASVVRTFVGSLFLAREGRIDIQQKDLRSHSIYVRNLEAAG
jgi:chromatin segregation and condensation protein Rec8/ScpA/Scc1 (kleisin family)